MGRSKAQSKRRPLEPPSDQRLGRKWASLGMSLGAIAMMAACGPGGPVPAFSPGPSTSPEPIPLLLPLPGVASAPPGTLREPQVVIRSRELTRELDGWWRLEGRLANAGELPAQEVGLTARFYDQWGVLVDTRDALLTPDLLEPGQEGRFTVTWPPDRKVDSVTLQPRWVYIPDTSQARGMLLGPQAW